MRNRAVALSIVLMTLISLWAVGAIAQDSSNVIQTARAAVQDSSGNGLGTVSFTPFNSKVLITADLANLPPGFHGFHIHTTGTCEAMDEMAFMAAGGHFNPSGASHPDHAGDLPVLLANADGTAYLSVLTDRFTVADLLDADGSAITVHADADNYANIPARYGPVTADAATPDPAIMAAIPDEETLKGGDSGDRIACGVIDEVLIDMSPAATLTATIDATGAASFDLTGTASTDLTLTPGVDVTVTGVDLTATVDLTPTVDLTVTGVDLTATVDLTPPVDLTPTVDLTVTGVDLTTTPDATAIGATPITTDPTATPVPG